jgi:SAM-dependent methyltransferase
MYRIFFEIQKKHWWFVTKKKIVLDTIDRFFKKDDQTKILDIGCGSGLMLNALSKIGPTYGMDMSDEAIEFSKEIYSGDIAQGSLPDQVPYENNFFSLITALDIIEHIDRDIDSLTAMRDLLTPGGKIIITVPAYMFLWSPFDDMNEHKRRYTLTELKTKLLQTGFTIEKISYYNTLLFPIVFVVRLLNNVLNRDGASDMDIPSPPVNFILRKIFSFEMYLLRFLNLPFGVSVIAVVRK